MTDSEGPHLWLCGACDGEGVLPDLDGFLGSCFNCLGKGGGPCDCTDRDVVLAQVRPVGYITEAGLSPADPWTHVDGRRVRDAGNLCPRCGREAGLVEDEWGTYELCCPFWRPGREPADSL